MKKSIDVSGLKLTYDNSLKETSNQVIKKIQENKDGLKKIKSQFDDLKNKVKTLKIQTQSLEIFLKDTNPEMYKEMDKLLNNEDNKEEAKVI